MLSSQTKDEVTDAAVSKLREAVGGSLTVEAILEADEKDIADAIAKVGFRRRKTQLARSFSRRASTISSGIPDILNRRHKSCRMNSALMFLKL